MTWSGTRQGRRIELENSMRWKYALSAVLIAFMVGIVTAHPQNIPDDAKAHPGRIVQTFVENGVSVELAITRIEDVVSDQPLSTGDNVSISFTIKDAASGEPTRGLHPMGWVDKRRSKSAPTADEMRDKIAAFLGGFLSIEADIDLNAYRLWVINHDKTVSVINPLTVFSRTKLESIILLPGLGADLAFTPDQKLLFVTMPDNDAVAVIDTASRLLLKTISTGPGTHPMRLLPQPDGKLMWIGLDKNTQIASIDTASLAVSGTIEVGHGRHNLIWIPDDELIGVTNSDDNTLAIIDAHRRKRLHSVSVGKTPITLDYSPASELIYVASLNGDGISVVNPDSGAVVTTLPTAPGLVDLGLAPSGRHGIVLNQFENTAIVFDTATNTIVDRIEVVPGPDQVIFTDAFAYIRGIDSAAVSLIQLSTLGVQQGSPAEIIAGKLPASARPDDLNIAPMIVPTPEGNEVMIANTPDMGMYYYVEGMLAPMGTFTNYKRRPLGLALLDNSLLEVSPGVYAVNTILPEAGIQDVFFVVDQPRVVKRLDFTVIPSAEERKIQDQAIAIKVPDESLQAAPKDDTDIQFTISTQNGEEPVVGLRDILVTLVRETGQWRSSQYAHEIGDGMYAVQQNFPDPGIYSMVFWVESHGVTPSSSPVFKIRVFHEQSSRAKP